MTDVKKPPILKPQETVRVVEKLGFVRSQKSKGGHLRYCHPDGRKTSIPMHKGEDIGRGAHTNGFARGGVFRQGKRGGVFLPRP